MEKLEVFKACDQVTADHLKHATRESLCLVFVFMLHLVMFADFLTYSYPLMYKNM